MSSLVERLRAVDDVEMGGVCEVSVYRNPDGPEAANEIERLNRECEQRLQATQIAQDQAMANGAEANSLRAALKLATEALKAAREALSLHKGGRDES